VAQRTKLDFSWGGFFGGFYWRFFLRWVHPKKPTRFFWVCTRVSEPCSKYTLIWTAVVFLHRHQNLLIYLWQCEWVKAEATTTMWPLVGPWLNNCLSSVNSQLTQKLRLQSSTWIDKVILIKNLDCYDIVHNQPQTISCYRVPRDLDWHPTVRARRANICINDLHQDDTHMGCLVAR